jgi:hypothetical protein
MTAHVLSWSRHGTTGTKSSYCADTCQILLAFRGPFRFDTAIVRASGASAKTSSAPAYLVYFPDICSTRKYDRGMINKGEPQAATNKYEGSDDSAFIHRFENPHRRACRRRSLGLSRRDPGGHISC